MSYCACLKAMGLIGPREIPFFRLQTLTCDSFAALLPEKMQSSSFERSTDRSNDNGTLTNKSY